MFADRTCAPRAAVLFAVLLAACGSAKPAAGGADAGPPDTTAPVAPDVELFSPSPTEDAKVRLTVRDCSDRAAVLANEGAQPEKDDASWQPCSTGSGAIEATLAQGGGLHLVRVWAKDQAGNVSATAATVDVVRGSMFAVGQAHTCALVAGQVRCWGSNAAGELGTGASDAQAAAPQLLSSLGNKVDAIASASHARHTCALKEGGVWCWGADELGQLGVAQAPDTCGEVPCAKTPVQVTDAAGQPLQGAVELALGQYFSCVRLSTGTVRCWGANGLGQLGNGAGGGDSDHETAPQDVAHLTGVRHLSSGVATVCALADKLQCWGFDSQPGVGTGNASLFGASGTATCAHGGLCQKSPLAPEQFASAPVPDDVAAGYFQACALTKGSVRCWGAGFLGQLGNGDDQNSAAPVEPLLLGEPADLLALGAHHGCARVTDGRLLCWGLDDAGQLGSLASDRCGSEREFACSRVPVEVLDLAHVRALAVGRYHACAEAEGEVRCWGTDAHGELGTSAGETCVVEGTSGPCSHRPLAVTGLLDK